MAAGPLGVAAQPGGSARATGKRVTKKGTSKQSIRLLIHADQRAAPLWPSPTRNVICRARTVIVTTQSSDLLDKRDIPLESVLVVRADHGVTTIGPLDEAGQSVVRQRLYSIGELLRIGQIRPDLRTPPANHDAPARPAPEASPT